MKSRPLAIVHGGTAFFDEEIVIEIHKAGDVAGLCSQKLSNSRLR